MKGLYSGRQIKALATKKAKITRSQTATQAVKAITTKYGSVADNGKYFHTGKGVWVKYSLANDSKRTGKLAVSKAQWRAQPHKLDYPGVDTKKGVEKKEVKAGKPKFSLSSIKSPAKLSSRTKKTPAKMVHKAAVKSMPKKATPSTRRRYASFSRPLGSWFNPGVPFKYEDTRASDKDFRYNRMPHTVISTETKISPEKIKSYELVDLAEGRKMQALIKYSNAVRYFTDGMKDQVERQILKGAIATRKDVEPYIAKAKKIMEKKEIKTNGSPYDTLKFKIRRASVLPKPEKPKGRTAKKNLKMGDNFKYRPSAIQSLRLTQEQKAIIASRKAAKVPAKKVRAKKVKLPPEEVEINKIKELEEKHNKLSNDIEKYLKVHYDFTKHLADMRQRKAPDTSGMEANVSGTMEHVKKLRAEVEKIQEDIRQHKLKLRNIDEKNKKARVVDEAREDWNSQCKLFMSGKIPFRDRNAKECYNRHARAAGI